MVIGYVPGAAVFVAAMVSFAVGAPVDRFAAGVTVTPAGSAAPLVCAAVRTTAAVDGNPLANAPLRFTDPLEPSSTAAAEALVVNVNAGTTVNAKVAV